MAARASLVKPRGPRRESDGADHHRKHEQGDQPDPEERQERGLIARVLVGRNDCAVEMAAEEGSLAAREIQPMPGPADGIHCLFFLSSCTANYPPKKGASAE